KLARWPSRHSVSRYSRCSASMRSISSSERARSGGRGEKSKFPAKGDRGLSDSVIGICSVAGNVDFDFVVLFQSQCFDDRGGKANGKAVAPLRDLHDMPCRYSSRDEYAIAGAIKKEGIASVGSSAGRHACHHLLALMGCKTLPRVLVSRTRRPETASRR